MDNLVIGGKNYISSKRAAEVMGYTQDYIGQLARSGKISAERVSGVWYVSEDEFSGLSKKKTIQNSGDITNKTNTQEKSDTTKDKNLITINGVNYTSSKRAAEIMGYTQDYIGQLCRSGKVDAKQIGRVWYVPESVVYKGINKTTNNVQETTFNKVESTDGIPPRGEVSKVEALGDIVVFKKENKDEKPIKLEELQEVKDEVVAVEEQPQKEKVKESEAPLEAGTEDSVGSNGEEATVVQKVELEEKPVQKEKETKSADSEEYYYPSFLSASYSIDDTPLVPMPKRSREPVLHRIVAEEKKDTFDHNVAVRRIPAHSAPTLQRQESRRVQRITDDILKPKKLEERSLSIKSPLSLMKMASLGVAVVLFASVVTYVPNISIFSSSTGMLKDVYSLKAPQSDALKAEVVTSTSKTTLLETVVGAFSGLFEDTIEYKAK